MEPSKLDHHQHGRQEQLRSRAVTAPPGPPPARSNHAWNSNFLLKPEESINSNVARACSVSSIEPEEIYEALLSPPLSTSMVNDLGFHWPCGADTSNNQGQLGKTTEDLSDSMLKLSSFGAVWNLGEHLSPSTSCSSKYEQQGLQDLDVGLLYHMDRPHHSARATHHTLLSQNATSFGGCAAASQQLGTYNKIVVATSPSPSSFTTSFSMQELQALDLLASARFGETLRQPSLTNVAFGQGAACGLSHIPLPTPGSSKELHKISSLLDGVSEGKRANGIPEHKASPPAAKKLRPEPRPSTSSFKVRKEKLGDRVAALQQLVAPFGKTDTASVLTEAVGYIKFLQEQVQTLSMPYLRSSSKSKIRATQVVSNEERDDVKQDLRSRGLCLVPLSYTSYFTGDSGTMWSPSYFRGT